MTEGITQEIRVKECLDQLTDKEPDIFLVSNDGARIGIHRFTIGLFSKFLNTLVKHSDPVSYISVPSSGSALRHLVTMLTMGITIANNKDDLKEVSDIAYMLGVDFAGWQLGVGRKKHKKYKSDTSIATTTSDLKEVVKEENKNETSSQQPSFDKNEVNEHEINFDVSESDDEYDEDEADVKTENPNLECYVYECEETFLLKSDLRKHIEDLHPSKNEIKSSEHDITVSNQLQCYFCEKWFKSKKNRGHHMRTIHREVTKIDRKIPCKVCLKIHGFKPQDDKHYTCELCDKMFYGSERLGNHKTIKHGLRKRAVKIAITYDPDNPNHCHRCKTALRTQSELIMHEDTKHIEELDSEFYSCRFCDRKIRIRQRNAIVEHLRKHTGERPEICTYCGMSFKQKKSLQNHERLHTGEKPYKCEYCFSAFTQRSALTSHQKSRNGCHAN